MKPLQRLEQLILTLWVGSQLAIGYLAVPVLFHQLDDRQLAGELAGQMFRWVYDLGLVCGLFLLMSVFYSSRHTFHKQWRHYVVLAMLLLIVMGLFVLQPQMAAIKLQPGWYEQTELMSRFGRLHGISSVLYLLTSALGVVLVVKGLRDQASD